MIKIYYIIFVFILSCFARGQISGTVVDSIKNIPIIDVNVFIENTSIGIKTDSSGYFQLADLDITDPIIVFQHVAFKTVRKQLFFSITDSVLLEIELIEKPYFADKITVIESRYPTLSLIPLMSSISITDSIILKTPGGFDDPLKTAQTYPGLNFIQDYSANLIIRGSGPSEQAIVLDGVLLHNPYRGRGAGFGGISIINPEIIKNMNIEYGGYSARYGKRTGGLVNFVTKDGTYEWKNNISVNLIAARYFVQGSIMDNLTFTLSARRSYYDWLIKKHEAQNIVFPKYYDVFGKLTWLIDKKNIVRFTQIIGSEGLKINENENLSGNLITSSENLISILSWKYFFSDKLQYQLSYIYQDNNDNFDSEDIQDGIYYNSKFEISTISGLMRWDILKYSTLLSGFSVSHKNLAFEETWLPSFNFYEYEGFAENEFVVSESFKYRFGARFIYNDLYKKSRMSPRLSFQWYPTKQISVSGNTGTFYQFPEGIQIFNDPERLEVYDYNAGEPISSIYNALNIKYNYTLSSSITAEVYSKKADNYPGYESQNWEYQSYTQGYELYSYGLDLYYSYSAEKLNSSLGYSYSKTRLKRENSKDWQAAYFDQRHNFKVKAEYSFSKYWSINSSLNSGSGFPFYDKALWGIDDFGRLRKIESKSTMRIGYFRWDMRLTYTLNDFSIYLEVINITDARNADRVINLKDQDVTFNDYFGRVTFETNILYMIPRIPLIGISYTF